VRTPWVCLCLPAALSPAATQDQSADWQQLFNGKGLIGWKHVGRGEDVVENSLLRTQGGSGVLDWAEGKFGSWVIRVVYKMRPAYSSECPMYRRTSTENGCTAAMRFTSTMNRKRLAKMNTT
jgi:hypothetical protein